jgi:hypothetical protein
MREKSSERMSWEISYLSFVAVPVVVDSNKIIKNKEENAWEWDNQSTNQRLIEPNQ